MGGGTRNSARWKVEHEVDQLVNHRQALQVVESLDLEHLVIYKRQDALDLANVPDEQRIRAVFPIVDSDTRVGFSNSNALGKVYNFFGLRAVRAGW